MWFIKHIKTGEILNINQEKTTIGRLGTTYVLKNDDSISRKHCTFLLKQNELQIIDDGAKYGSNVQKASSEVHQVSKEPMTLKDGDKIQFGCYENIWEIHSKMESRGGIKRKSDENSLSKSNISKKSKENPINAKIMDKFDIIIDSDDDEPIGRGCRRKNQIVYSEDTVPSSSTSKDKSTDNKNKKAPQKDEKAIQSTKKVEQAKKPQVEPLTESQKPSKDVARSQIVNHDSDEDIFSASHSNTGSNNRKVIIDSDDDLMAFNVPLKAANTRKRPSNDTEVGASSKKIPKIVKNTQNQVTAEIKKTVPQTSTKKASSDEVDKSISRAPSTITSHISRKRDHDDETFDFDQLSNKFQIKKPRHVKQIETSSEELTPIPSTSTASIKSVSYKTSNITDKEAFASFVYDIDEDSGSWLSTRVSKIKVKDEISDETDNSINNSIESHYSVNVNIIRKNVSLDTTCESKKSFRKQKFLESNHVVTLKKLNVNEMNFCYSKQEDLGDDWS